MTPLFLLCALALPPMSKDKQFHALRDMIQKYYPNFELIQVHEDERLISTTDLHTPFIFRGQKVYLRRSA